MSLRVVQWATGNIGTYALRGVIGHPGLRRPPGIRSTLDLPQVVATLG
ncbi:MAG TPA: hypothetical protein VIX41_13975 [Acidimicrobiales bacterium]